MIRVERRWSMARALCMGLLAMPLLFGSAPAMAAAVFEGVGILPGATKSQVNAISADGSTVVGGNSMWGQQDGGAFRWTAGGGIQGLGSTFVYSQAREVSSDGTVIAGSQSNEGQAQDAFRWTQPEGIVPMSGIAHLLELPAGMTQDGSTIVGNGYDMAGLGRFDPTPFSWTAAGGKVELTSPPVSLTYGTFGDVVLDVSPDGVTLVGSMNTAFDCNCVSQAWSWSAGSGRIELPNLPDRFEEDPAFPEDFDPGGSGTSKISGDGTAIVGRSEEQAVLWSSGSVLNLDDRLRGPGDDDQDFWSAAHGVTADGSTVVGKKSLDAGATWTAFIWDAANGMRDLKTVLEGMGLDLTGWTLTSAVDISDDGLRIVGNGINPLGASEGWVVTVPEPGTGSLLLLGLLGLVGKRSTARRR